MIMSFWKKHSTNSFAQSGQLWIVSLKGRAGPAKLKQLPQAADWWATCTSLFHVLDWKCGGEESVGLDYRRGGGGGVGAATSLGEATFGMLSQVQGSLGLAMWVRTIA